MSELFEALFYSFFCQIQNEFMEALMRPSICLSDLFWGSRLQRDGTELHRASERTAHQEERHNKRAVVHPKASHSALCVTPPLSHLVQRPCHLLYEPRVPACCSLLTTRLPLNINAAIKDHSQVPLIGGRVRKHTHMHTHA